VGLELEAPSGLGSASADQQQRRHDGPEGDENSERVDDAVAAEVFPFLPGRTHQLQAFEEKDWEDAGHQVEDDAAEEGESKRAQEGDGAAGCAGDGRGDSDFAGDDGCGDVVCITVGDFEDAVERRRQSGEFGGALDAEANAVF